MSIYLKIFKFIYSKMGSFGKTWQLFRRELTKNGLASTQALVYRYSAQYYFEQWQSSKEPKKIIVLSMPHTIFVANLISNTLKKVNIDSSIEIATKKESFENALYIVICPQAYQKLPDLYIAFQMEQTVSDRWFAKKNLLKLQKALLVLDYSLQNIEYLSKLLPLSQLYYAPLSTTQLDFKLEKSLETNHHEYDILFYGDTNNERRQKYLNKLQEKYNVKIINNAFGKDIWNETPKAKLVLNIHYYENALLETTRLYECLSNNAVIISEKSSDLSLHHDLIDIVDFVDIDDVDQMINRIDYWLNQPEEYSAFKNKIIQFNARKHSMSDFYLFRALLALELIDFDLFFNKTKEIWSPQSNFWCLGLPESAVRNTEFKKELCKFSDIWAFPGLRHQIPWVGCGLSYKYMLTYAKEYNYPFISICEDDVQFPEQFCDNYSHILKFLNQDHIKWDIFSGCLTDTHPEITASLIQDTSNYKLIKTNHCTGMVFNIYNKSIFQFISNWDYKNTALASNAIDRYIDQKSNLNIITTLPYLVTHKEDAQTTLWCRSNAFTYTAMINKSQEKLRELIE